MSAIKPGDSKREEFRKYLEKAGVLNALTKVLVGLYEEPDKPNDAIEYLKQQLSVNTPDQLEMDALRQESKDLRNQVSQLTEEVKQLKSMLNENEPSIDRQSTNTEAS